MHPSKEIVHELLAKLDGWQEAGRMEMCVTSTITKKSWLKEEAQTDFKNVPSEFSYRRFLREEA